jgi:cytochrome oxidase assembly protein ShyY1
VRLWLRPALLGLHAFAIVAVGFCLVMGLWQLGVYEGRQGDAKEAALHEVEPLAEGGRPSEPVRSDLQDQRVTVTGRFADDDVVVKRDDGSTWLVTPFVVGDRALLVVRGEGAEAPRSEVTTIEAVLEPSEPGGTALAPDRSTNAIPVPVLLNDLPQELYGGYAISLTDTGLPLVEPPEPGVSWTEGLRNLAYALQWWIFGAFAVFMWWRMASETVAEAREERAATLAP